MKALISSFLFFGLVSSGTLHAEAQHEGEAVDSRATNTFADYDTLATKLENWGKKITEGARVESLDKEKGNFVIQLSKAESEDAAKLLKRIKWYRNEIVACENADASSKVLGTVLDECIAPGLLSKAAQSAVEKDSRWEMSLSISEVLSCKIRIADYYKEKLDTSKGLDASKFSADREMSEKIDSLFKLFALGNTEWQATEKLSGDLIDSLSDVRLENRCEVGATKVATVAAQEQMPKMPPATQPVQYPPTSLVQKQPEYQQQQTQQYVAPEGGYKAPVGGYKAPIGGYKYNPAAYNPQNFDYEGGGYGGFNPALYMMQPYNKGNDRSYNHPKQFPQYYPQRNFDRGPVQVGVNTGRYPYQQPYQPPAYPPFFFPSVPSIPPIIGIAGGSSCFTCGGGSSRSYIPAPIPDPTPSPCLMGMCQPLPCLGAQCMNRPQPIPNACLPLNQGYVGLNVGNLNCPVPGTPTIPGMPGYPGTQPPNIGRPPVVGYPPITNYPTQPGFPTQPGYPTQPSYPIQPSYPVQPGFPTQPTIPYNPNLTPGYQTQYQSVPVSPTTYRVPRGMVGRK